MSDVRRFFRNGRIGWGALLVLLGAALPAARADVITGTDSNGTPVSILANFLDQDGDNAPLVLTHNGTTVNLTIPATGPGNYELMFGMKAGDGFLDLNQILKKNPPPPDPATGQFSYATTIGGNKYTISGSLETTNPINQSSWSVWVVYGLSGFPQVGQFFFSTTAGDPAFSFSVDDSNGNAIQFTDPNGSRAPEPASLALAGLGLAGLAGYGWRRRLAV